MVKLVSATEESTTEWAMGTELLFSLVSQEMLWGCECSMHICVCPSYT